MAVGLYEDHRAWEFRIKIEEDRIECLKFSKNKKMIH